MTTQTACERDCLSIELRYRLLIQMPERDHAIRLLRFSWDRARLLVGSVGGVARWLRLNDGRMEQPLLVHHNPNEYLSLSPDGRFALSGGGVSVWYWRLADRARLRHLTAARGVIRRMALADDELIACGCEDGTVILWHAREERVRSYWSAHRERIQALAFVPGSRALLSAGSDGTIRLWDVSSARLLRQIEAGGPVHTLAVSPDGQWIAAAVDVAGAPISCWRLADGMPIAALPLVAGETARAMAIAPDGTQIAIGQGDGTVSIWALADPSQPLTLLRIEQPITALAYGASADLAAGTIAGQVHVWEIRDQGDTGGAVISEA